MLALSAPHPLWLAGEAPDPPPLLESAYGVSGKRENLTVFTGPGEQTAEKAVDWLIK